MNPQIVKYSEKITRLEDSNTLLMKASDLLWGANSFPPTIYIEGIIENERTKFDYYKAYKNGDNIIKHCEYRNDVLNFKLIVHNN